MDIPFEKVEAYAARKLTEQQIADVLDIDFPALKADRPLLAQYREAIRKGSAKGAADIANTLYNRAKAGDTTAAAALGRKNR